MYDLVEWAAAQPWSDVRQAHLDRLGHELRGARREVASVTSFYLYSLSRGIPHALRPAALTRRRASARRP
ncbi:MAG: hypothetical protein ACRDPF_20500 [Streptosporangiaceae bacterium]